jgi:hypothetical protein
MAMKHRDGRRCQKNMEFSGTFRSLVQRRWKGSLVCLLGTLGLIVITGVRSHAGDSPFEDSTPEAIVEQNVAPPTIPVSRPAVERTLETEEKLQRVVDLYFEESPLEEVISRLADEGEIPILIDRVALESIDVSPSTPITFHSHAYRTETLLHFICEELDCTFYVRDGILVITSKEEAEATQSVRVYHCGDLMAIVPDEDKDSSDHSEANVSVESNAVHSVELAVGGRAGAVTGPQPAPCKIRRSVEEIFTTYLTESVEPDSWSDHGGQGTVVGLKNGVIVVRQSYAVHRAIEKLLEDLRSVVREGPGSSSEKG